MHDKLQKLVGKSFSYLGYQWILIEILPELDSLVLRRLDATKRVQANQYGDANRFCDETVTLKITDPDTLGYSEEITTLLSGIIKNTPD